MNKENNIRKSIESIEEAYEYMLAYAAQGRSDEGAGPDGAQIRTFLEQYLASISSINIGINQLAKDNPIVTDFINSFQSDSASMASVLQIMLDKKNISSEVVDNVNGLILVRSYLTSLFFLDKVLLDS